MGYSNSPLGKIKTKKNKYFGIKQTSCHNKVSDFSALLIQPKNHYVVKICHHLGHGLHHLRLSTLKVAENTKAASPYVNIGCQCSPLTFLDQYGTTQGNCLSADSTGAR